MEADLSPEEILQKVMGAIEDFYYGDSETSGEAIFNKFAAKNQHIFADDCDL